MLFGQAATVPAKQSNGTPPSAPSTPASYSAGPIAIVPIDSRDPGTAASVTGALEVTNGKAMIAAEGSVTSGSRTTEVTLPHRGVLRVCASTTVKLASDRSVPAGGDAPGLLMAIDRGALETSFATGRNADIVLTPDFRILIGGPGSSELKVRLGQQGDTCIDNTGADAPYVVVTSLFDTGLYRVQPGQRVMFQHGSLREVVDQEKEPCGCPPEPSKTGANEFPLAQSEGLAPTPAPAPTPPAAVNRGDFGGPIRSSPNHRDFSRRALCCAPPKTRILHPDWPLLQTNFRRRLEGLERIERRKVFSHSECPKTAQRPVGVQVRPAGCLLRRLSPTILTRLQSSRFPRPGGQPCTAWRI